MLCIDIETIPLAESLAVPFDRASATPPANYKTPEAISNWLDKAEAEYTTARVKACSINPRLGRIVCLSYALGNVDAKPQSLYAETPEQEADLLRQFWALCLDKDVDRLVTWNGAFDLRWIVVRSLANKILPSVGVTQWFKRYTTYPHCDVKAFLLQEWGSKVAGEGLDEWSAFFGIDGKPEGVDGSKVYPMFLAGQHAEIRQYCEADVRSTLQMFRAILPFI